MPKLNRAARQGKRFDASTSRSDMQVFDFDHKKEDHHRDGDGEKRSKRTLLLPVSMHRLRRYTCGESRFLHCLRQPSRIAHQHRRGFGCVSAGRQSSSRACRMLARARSAARNSSTTCRIHHGDAVAEMRNKEIMADQDRAMRGATPVF